MECDGAVGMMGMMPWMLVWGLVGLALLAALVAGTVWLVQSSARSGRPEARETPEEILRRRYAAGELDEDEYLRRLAGLQS